MKTRWLVINLNFGFIEKVFSTEKDANDYADKHGDDGSYHSTGYALSVIPLEITKNDNGKAIIVTHDPKAAHAKYEKDALKILSKMFGIKPKGGK